MGSVVSMDVSVANIWRSWYMFRQGKKKTSEIDLFSYHLETNLSQLSYDLTVGRYRHGSYRSFYLTDTKKRLISVAPIRDRVVHRLFYNYLLQIFDHTFIYDAWSCRVGKGLLGAMKRTQALLKKYRYAYVWRGDITKFFDTVDHEVLRERIARRVTDAYVLQLIDTIIRSYSVTPGVGIPIGNLTSQVFTNIYLHEFDRYIFHTIKPLGYVRYGDDFILIAQDKEHLELCREHLIVFLDQILKLSIHRTNDIMVPVYRGIHFLGCDMYPTGKRPRKRMFARIKQRLNMSNIFSYRALLLAHSKEKMVKWIDWKILELMENEVYLSKEVNNGISVVPAFAEQAQSLIAIQQACYLTAYVHPEHGINRADIEEKNNRLARPVAIERIKKRINNSQEMWLVAMDGEVPVGFIAAKKADEDSDQRIGRLFVSPEQQGRGIGSHLMRELLPRFNPNSPIKLQVDAYNTHAIDFYTNFGFSDVKEAQPIKLPHNKEIPTREMIKNPIQESIAL